MGACCSTKPTRVILFDEILNNEKLIQWINPPWDTDYKQFHAALMEFLEEASPKFLRKSANGKPTQIDIEVGPFFENSKLIYK